MNKQLKEQIIIPTRLCTNDSDKLFKGFTAAHVTELKLLLIMISEANRRVMYEKKSTGYTQMEINNKGEYNIIKKFKKSKDDLRNAFLNVCKISEFVKDVIITEEGDVEFLLCNKLMKELRDGYVTIISINDTDLLFKRRHINHIIIIIKISMSKDCDFNIYRAYAEKLLGVNPNAKYTDRVKQVKRVLNTIRPVIYISRKSGAKNDMFVIDMEQLNYTK